MRICVTRAKNMANVSPFTSWQTVFLWLHAEPLDSAESFTVVWHLLAICLVCNIKSQKSGDWQITHAHAYTHANACHKYTDNEAATVITSLLCLLALSSWHFVWALNFDRTKSFLWPRLQGHEKVTSIYFKFMRNHCKLFLRNNIYMTVASIGLHLHESRPCV